MIEQKHHTRDTLLERFDALGLATTTVDHAPVFTVEEAREECGHMPGAHCKNLFLKDKKGILWLVVALENRLINMKDLKSRIGSHHLSFGKPELLMEVLGVEPGSVTPFALINDMDKRCNVVLDSEMMGFDVLNYHPLINDATTTLKPDDLLKFISSCGFVAAVIDLA